MRQCDSSRLWNSVAREREREREPGWLFVVARLTLAFGVAVVVFSRLASRIVFFFFLSPSPSRYLPTHWFAYVHCVSPIHYQRALKNQQIDSLAVPAQARDSAPTTNEATRRPGERPWPHPTRPGKRNISARAIEFETSSPSTP